MLELCANCASHTCRPLPQHTSQAFADIGATAPALASCATPVSRVCERLAAQPEALNAAMLDCELAASTVPFERLFELMHRLCYHVGLAADVPDRKAARMSRSLAVYVYMLDTAGSGAPTCRQAGARLQQSAGSSLPAQPAQRYKLLTWS